MNRAAANHNIRKGEKMGNLQSKKKKKLHTKSQPKIQGDHVNNYLQWESDGRICRSQLREGFGENVDT